MKTRITPTQYWTNKLANGVMKFDNLSLGDKFIAELIKNLPKTADISEIEVSNNRLSSRGAKAIFSTINEQVNKIDISFNPDIKIDAYNFLAKFILKDYKYPLPLNIL